MPRRLPFLFCYMLLLLAACSRPHVQPYAAPAATPILSQFSLMFSDGAVLPVRSWLPDGELRSVVIALHGFNDYSRAFEGAGQYLSRRGIGLYAYDQRGFGASPSHGIWPGEDNLTADLAHMVQAVKATHPGVPVYVLGESMGGAVAITALAKPGFPAIDGAILSAPAVWGSDTLNALYRMTLWTLVHTAPSMQLTGQGLKIQASDNVEMLKRLGRDPLVIKRTRVDAIYGIVALMDSAYAKVPQVNAPVLLLYGGRDQVIPPEPVHQSSGRFAKAPTVAFYPEGYHMLLRDLNADKVLNDIVYWTEKQDNALPSGAGNGWPRP